MLYYNIVFKVSHEDLPIIISPEIMELYNTYRDKDYKYFIF